METLKIAIGIMFITLFSCRGLVPIAQEGECSFFWEKCEPVQGIALINNHLYPYTHKMVYNNGGIFFTKKVLYLGNGVDYNEYMLSELRKVVNSCDNTRPPELKIRVVGK